MSGRPEPADACPFEEDVLVLQDGVLDPTRRMVVEAHLAVCASCAGIDETTERAATALRAATLPSLGAADLALARLDARPAARPVLRAAAAAAALLAVAAVSAAVARRTVDVRTESADGETTSVPDGPRTAPGPARDSVVGRRTPTPPEDGASGSGGDPSTPIDVPDERRAPAVAGAAPAGAREDDSPEGPPAPFVRHVFDDLRDRVAAIPDDAAPDDPALVATVHRVRSTGAAGACALAELLDPEDEPTARHAIRVAAQVRSAQFVQPLGRLLADGRFSRDAAGALAAVGTPAAASQLVAAIEGPSRGAALAALSEWRGAGAFDAVAARLLADALGPSDLLRLLDAAVGMDARRAARLLLDLAADEGARDAAESVLRARRSELVPALLPLAAKGDGLVAAAAVRALGVAGDAAAVPALREAGSRAALARSAAEALLRIGTREAVAAAFDVASSPRAPAGTLAAFDGCAAAVPHLAAEATDARPVRRLAAIDALGRTRSAAAVPHLTRAGVEPSQRAAAVEALARIGGDDAAAVLAEWARPRGADTALVAALGATGSETAVPALRSLARESSLGVPVAQALGGIAARESVLALADLLAEPRTARAAADSLAALPAGVVVPALVDRLDEPSAAGRAHRALVLVAGADLGRAPEAWRTWWDQRRPRTPERTR